MPIWFWFCVGAVVFAVGNGLVWSLCVMAAKSDTVIERTLRREGRGIHQTWVH